ncbi:Thioredoxin [archaeon HR06]|nr:Thioredoxin [archaeon HR06]
MEEDKELDRIIKEKMRRLMEKKEEKYNTIINLTSENFFKVINGEKPVLVDFWAEWCMPCRIMHPIFERLAVKFKDKVIFARLNVDEYGEIASLFRVFSIPTFILFHKGNPIDAVVGAVGEEGLLKLLRKYIVED